MTLRPDTRPLYLLVIDKIKNDIEIGILKPGNRLPSEFDLSKELGISRATLREALRILEDENIITRKHGVGTFINEKPVYTSGIEELNSITNMIEKNGQTAGTIYVNIIQTLSSRDDMKNFNLEHEKNLLKIERIRTADGEPVVYCIDKIPNEILPEDFNLKRDGSLFQTLEQKANVSIHYALTEIIPIGFHDEISSILHSPPESSLLVLKQVHYDVLDRPVLVSMNYFRADKFRFKVLRRR